MMMMMMMNRNSSIDTLGPSRVDTARICCLISSGPTVHAAAQAELPELPGVVIVPTVGGRDEPEAW